MSNIDEIKSILPIKIRSVIELKNVYEIRLRTDRPVITYSQDGERVYTAYIMDNRDIRQCLEYISNYSVYAYQDNIRQGFITIRGGHRVGVCGHVISENGHIKSQQYISFINIRIAHEINGCADSVMDFITSSVKSVHNKDASDVKNNYVTATELIEKIGHTLIISSPGCGKTTLLRDIVRQLSDGNAYRQGVRVSLIDERGELAACYQGAPQNNTGMRTDVIDGCSKYDGMLLMIRSMNPQIVAVDEIGERQDIEALEYIINSGCKVLATMHAASLSEAMEKPYINKLINKSMFSRIIILGSDGTRGNIKELINLNEGN